MDLHETVSSLLTNVDPGSPAMAQRIRDALRADSVDLLSHDGSRFTAIAETGTGERVPADREAALASLRASGVAVMRSHESNADGVKLHELFAPIETLMHGVVGAIVITRRTAFSATEIDLCRLLGIALGSEPPWARHTSASTG